MVKLLDLVQGTSLMLPNGRSELTRSALTHVELAPAPKAGLLPLPLGKGDLLRDSTSFLYTYFSGINA